MSEQSCWKNKTPAISDNFDRSKSQ